jgi:hypothetical protein
MAILDSLNFEDADLATLCTANNWTDSSGGNCTLSTTQKHTGSKALYVPQPGYVNRTIQKSYVTYHPNVRTLYFRMWFRLENLPPYAGNSIAAQGVTVTTN